MTNEILKFFIHRPQLWHSGKTHVLLSGGGGFESLFHATVLMVGNISPTLAARPVSYLLLIVIETIHSVSTLPVLCTEGELEI